MNKQNPTKQKADTASSYDADVTAIVDALMADPTRAEDAKALLTHKLAGPDVVRLAVPKTKPAQRAADEDAEDELWDNLPV